MGRRDHAKTPARRWKLLLGAATVSWFALLAWCATMIWDIEQKRESLRAHVAWILEADGARQAIEGQIAIVEDAAQDGPPPIPPALVEHLRTQLFSGAPDTVALQGRSANTWPQYVDDLEEASEDATSGDPTDASAFRRAASRVVRVLSNRVDLARATTSRVSEELDASWIRLHIVAGIALVAVGLLSLSLITLAKQSRTLASSRTQLEDRERRYRDLVELSKDLVWSVDTEGRWTFLNDTAREVYGRQPAEMIGRPFTEVLAPERVEPDLEAFQTILAGTPLLRHETVHVHRDGHRIPLLFNAVALRDDAGNVIGTTGTATDISDLLTMQERLRQDERLRSIGSLAGGVAHDFNNLLTGVLGHIENLDTAGLSGATIKSLDTIRSAVLRGSRLTQQLLAFAGRQTLHREIIDVSSLGRDVHALLAGILGDGIEMISEGEDGLFIDVDRAQVEQALVNLVLNARDALPRGGRVDVNWRRRSLDAAGAAELSIAPGDWVEIRVEDDGVGMDERTLSRAFEPFFTSKPVGRGTGLGLPSAHGVVSQHGGVLRAESAMGEGSRFTIWLPCVEAPTGRPTAPRAFIPGHGAAVLNSVLLVEDDGVVREVIGRALSSAGYDVMRASTGTQGLELGLNRPIDVLVTDVRMPGMTGPELATRLREGRPDLPVIFMSGFTSDEALEDEWHDDPRATFLAKPFPPRAVREAIDRIAATVNASASEG